MIYVVQEIVKLSTKEREGYEGVFVPFIFVGGQTCE
jgi:hypothetical protein